MAKFPTFTAEIGRGNRMTGTATPDDFGAGVGRAAAGVGEQLGNTGDVLMTIKEDGEVRNVQLELAKLRADQAVAIEDARQSGRDYKEVEDEFADRIYSMDQLAGTAKGRDAVKLAQEQNRKEFFENVTRAKIVRASEHAQQEVVEYMEHASRGVAASPDQVDAFKAGLQMMVDGFSGLSPEQKTKVYSAMAADLDAAATERWIQIDPEFARDSLKKGAWADLDPKTRIAALGKAEEEIQARELRARADIRWKESERAVRADRAYSGYVNEILHPDQGSDIADSLAAAAQNDDLTGGQRISLANLAKSLAEDSITPTRTDPTVLADFIDRITKPYGDDQKMRSVDELTSAVVARKLNREDYEYLVRLYNTDRTPEGRSFNDEAKVMLDGIARRLDRSSLGNPDPDGKSLYTQFHKEFQTKVDELRKAGKDPRVLLNPASAEYAGNWVSAQRRQTLDVKLTQMREAIKGEMSKLVGANPDLDDPRRPSLSELAKQKGISEEEAYESLRPGQAFRIKDPATGQWMFGIKSNARGSE